MTKTDIDISLIAPATYGFFVKSSRVFIKKQYVVFLHKGTHWSYTFTRLDDPPVEFQCYYKAYGLYLHIRILASDCIISTTVVVCCDIIKTRDQILLYQNKQWNTQHGISKCKKIIKTSYSPHSSNDDISDVLQPPPLHPLPLPHHPPSQQQCEGLGGYS